MENILPTENAFSGEPGGGTDEHRKSPALSLGLKRQIETEIGVPTIPFPRTTDDEVYQFREPNKAYEDGAQEHELPDGLKTDGVQPRRWGTFLESKEPELPEPAHVTGPLAKEKL